jgi:hypothetical protein
MAELFRWDTRLEVKVGSETITPIESFTPTLNTPVQVLHSIEADNLMYVVQPETFTFTMTIRAVGTAVARLTDMARKHQKFSIGLAARRGSNWTFQSISFNECLITSVNPSNVVIDGAPAATFNCVCLEVIEQGAT